MPAERELLEERHRYRVYLALCGAMLPVAELASSLCEPGCERMIAYCPVCVEHVVGCNADAVLLVGSSVPSQVGR